jgi:hypothetical protein
LLLRQLQELQVIGSTLWTSSIIIVRYP